MMKSRGTGNEEVGEQKLINKDAILSAFGGGNKTKRKKTGNSMIEEDIFYVDEKRG